MKESKNSLPTKENYSISLEEIKSLNFFNYLEAIGGSLIKKKSSKYGRYYKWQNCSLWLRYDYKTGKYFYINLTGNDKGTLIDFIQEHIIGERNLGKVRRYVSDNLHLF
jgi:hypothetical protein